MTVSGLCRNRKLWVPFEPRTRDVVLRGSNLGPAKRPIQQSTPWPGQASVLKLARGQSGIRPTRRSLVNLENRTAWAAHKTHHTSAASPSPRPAWSFTQPSPGEVLQLGIGTSPPHSQPINVAQCERILFCNKQVKC